MFTFFLPLMGLNFLYYLTCITLYSKQIATDKLANKFLMYRLFQNPITNCFKGYQIAAVYLKVRSSYSKGFQRVFNRYNLICCLASCYSIVSLYPVGQATAAFAKSAYSKYSKFYF